MSRFVFLVAGLLANLVAFALLRSGSTESLNVRGAYLEVVGDLLGSLGVEKWVSTTVSKRLVQTASASVHTGTR